MTFLINSSRGINKVDINAMVGLQLKIDQAFVDHVKNIDELLAESPAFDPMNLAMLLSDNKNTEEQPSAQEIIEQQQNELVDNLLAKEQLYVKALENKTDQDISINSIQTKEEKLEEIKIAAPDDVKTRIAEEKAKISEKLAKEASTRKKKSPTNGT
jgi:Fe2+ transport system protein B